MVLNAIERSEDTLIILNFSIVLSETLPSLKKKAEMPQQMNDFGLGSGFCSYIGPGDCICLFLF